jgi:hypothetical protein
VQEQMQAGKLSSDLNTYPTNTPPRNQELMKHLQQLTMQSWRKQNT